MKKADLALIVQEMAGTTKVLATSIVETLFESMQKTLVKGDTVDISGFGKFVVAKSKAREARNPKTGETVKVAASQKPKFRAAKALKDAVAK